MAFEYKGLNVLDGKSYSVTVYSGVVTDVKECKDALDNFYICPGGLIDTQVNGALGYSTPLGWVSSLGDSLDGHVL